MSLIPKSRRGMLGRFAIGALIVVLFTATTTAVAGLLQFQQLASDIAGTPALQQSGTTTPDPGNPQTILIIGSDHRFGEPFSQSNTDTMMLVRLDPSSSTINVISIPRDLRVNIRGAPAKLNSAYSAGGPNLLIRVLREQVFPGLYVNHIVDVNFGGFESLVNAIGCVYTDVDHRYYNNTALTDYASINLHAGYQRLCGSDALDFVRYRHTDNDLVRNARQQAFIRWAKDQYGPGRLIANRDLLLRIFGQHTQTDPDLHTVDGLINLFNLVAFSAGHSIKQIKFPAIILPCAPQPAVATPLTPQTPCFVAANPDAEERAFDQLMTPTLPAPQNQGSPAGAKPGGPPSAPAPAPGPDLIDGSAGGATQAAALGGAGMPVYYPRLLATGSNYEGPAPPEYPRAYSLQDPGGAPHAAYRMVVLMNPLLGEYYGIQGTTWRDPPILNHPNQTRMVGGKKLALYFDGQKLTLVAWRNAGGVYWISNTLTDDLSNQQMLGIAASLTHS